MEAVDADLAQRLIDLNQRFYQNFAEAFSDTRGRLQPGVLRVLEDFPARADVLDLGCGNGTLAAELAGEGYAGRYVGVDFSEGLLAIARENVPRPASDAGREQGFDPAFVQADLTAPDWSKQLGGPPFDYVLAFALMHHLPGETIRLQLLRQVHELLKPGGRFIHSNWQFLNSERLRERIQAWESVGILDDEVDKWDYLLDWRRGGEGLRYVHYFTEEQLAELAAKSGFAVEDTFYSDGVTGDLGLYQIWMRAEG
jgi:SAM-dependent methyltransferase